MRPSSLLSLSLILARPVLYAFHLASLFITQRPDLHSLTSSTPSHTLVFRPHPIVHLLSRTRSASPRPLRSHLSLQTATSLSQNAIIFPLPPRCSSLCNDCPRTRSWQPTAQDEAYRTPSQAILVRPPLSCPSRFEVKANLPSSPSSRTKRDGTPVVSDTEAAVPGATAAAAGTIVQPVGPVGCSNSAGFGASCDQASGACWLVSLLPPLAIFLGTP